MMNAMYNFMTDVLNMSYFEGTYSDSKHEIEIQNLLEKNSFSRKDTSLKIKDRDFALKTGNLSSLNDLEYIYQPCGHNNNPDFIVKYNNKVYFIDAKTTMKVGCPTYNSALPKDEYIYIFSSKKYSQTTIFYGRHIVTTEMRKVYDSLSKIYELEKMLVSELEALGDKNPLGLSYYVRDMYSHRGHKTNYFTHEKRKDFEQDVLNSLL